MSNKYARRVDLDGHLTGIRDQLMELRDDQKELIKQLTRMHRIVSEQK